MQQVKPIKRSRQLAPLSREHHDGLLFVWKIKQGIAFGVPAKRISKYCEWYWQYILKDHFKKEESLMSALLPASDDLVHTMLEDHQAIIEKLEQVTEDPGYFSLQRLAQIIYYHIRFEERTLFRHVEELAPAEKIEQAAAMISRTSQPATTWTDEFWIKVKALSFEVSPNYKPSNN